MPGFINEKITFPGLDSSEQALFDTLMLVAENDGDSYRKRDAAGAIKKAFADHLRIEAEAMREDYRSIEKKLIKELAKRWRQE